LKYQRACFIASGPLDNVIARLGALDVPIVEGPVLRNRRDGPDPLGVCVRDPDLNLIEISEFAQ
jgi:catechol 2,3-dioxygenase-like lactoylglutathione lyase family enzyme